MKNHGLLVVSYVHFIMERRPLVQYFIKNFLLFIGKYASVLFVVLLAADRYCAMCKPTFCNRHRNYTNALIISLLTWTIAIGAAFPLFSYSEVAYLKFFNNKLHKLCIAKWPSSDTARW